MAHSPPHPRELLHETRFQPAWRALLAVLMAVVAWFAFTPSGGAPSFGIGDKIDHLLAFGALASAGALSARAGRCQTLQAALGLLAYGGFIELVQTQIPTRTGEWADLLADAVGMAGGLLLVALLRRLWRPTLRLERERCAD